MKYSLILIGAGGMGSAWLKTILSTKYFELIGIVEPNNVTQEKIKKEFNLPSNVFFSSLEQGFSKLKGDAVLIATPNYLHKEQIIASLKKGYHVLVEKPLASKIEDVKEILAEYSRDRIIMVAQNYRLLRESRTIKELIDSGIIGNIGYINYNFHIPAKFGGWRQNLKYLLLEDMSIHHFDLMRYFTGKNFTWVFAHSFKPEWSWHNGNPVAFVIGELEGIPFCYNGSWVSQENHTQWIGEIIIDGSTGALKLDSKGRLFLYKDNREKRIQLRKERKSPLKLLLEEFYNSMKENRLPSTDLLDNIHSFSAICASIYSAENKIKVDISDFLKKFLS